MPTSDPYNINPLLSVLIKLQPKRILDVGCGFGKYGVLLREYLDVWHERLTPDEWQVHIEGIEACEKYRNPIHAFAYNQVHYGEAQKVLPGLGPFDAIMIVDVIEHLEHAEAIDLVREAFKHSPVVVISTPRQFVEQRDLCDNPYERHRSWFKASDFPPEVHVQTIGVISCFIYVGSREPLAQEVFSLTEPADFVYLRSRAKLGMAGLPISVGLRSLCRWFG